MGLAVGVIGANVDLNLEELNASCVWDAANYDPDNDSVDFKFVFADNTTLEAAGTLVTASKARYTTIANDIQIPGRCEIQIKVTTLGGDIFLSEVLVINIEESLF